MISSPVTLEDFGQFSGLTPACVVDGERLETEKLAAFDNGYAAGWDDAADAQGKEIQNAERALAARMEELGFTFHEARAHVMESLRPLLTGIVESVVPRVLHETLGQRLDAAMQELAEGHPDPEVTFAVCPAEAESLRACLQKHARFPTRIEPNNALEPGFIQMRLGNAAREFDLTLIQTTLSNALDALNAQNEETLSHG